MPTCRFIVRILGGLVVGVVVVVVVVVVVYELNKLWPCSSLCTWRFLDLDCCATRALRSCCRNFNINLSSCNVKLRALCETLLVGCNLHISDTINTFQFLHTSVWPVYRSSSVINSKSVHYKSFRVLKPHILLLTSFPKRFPSALSMWLVVLSFEHFISWAISTLGSDLALLTTAMNSKQ